MRRAERASWAVGLVGLLAAALGWIFEAHVFPHAWLAALWTFLMWPLGSMALILAHALTGGRWGYAARPGLLAGVLVLPLLLPALVPMLLNLPGLYEWARPDAAHHLPGHAYLNLTFFAWRGIVYLIVWGAVAAAVLLLRGRALEVFAPAGLILLALTFTFAAIDATMSLQPEFVSNVFGMLQACSAGLLALSLAVLLAGVTAEREVLADLGKLLLALVVLWTYLDFMQLLIVWQSDLVKQVPWYLRRMRGFWGGVMAVIAIGHFLLPFFLLVFPQVQRSRRGVAGVAALLVAMAVLRSWWTVLPAVPRSLGWVDIACMAAVGGIAGAAAMWAQRRPFLMRRAAPHG